MSDRKPYSSDVSDEQWALVEPVITAWKAGHPSVSGHQGKYAIDGPRVFRTGVVRLKATLRAA